MQTLTVNKESMWLFSLVFLLVCYLSAHGQLVDQTDPGTPDIRTVLLAVTELKQQVQDLKQYQAKDLSIRTSLEKKYEYILQENYRLRTRVEILENLSHNVKQKLSSSSVNNQQENVIHEHTDVKSVTVEQTGPPETSESTLTGSAETSESTFLADTLTGRRREPKHLKHDFSLRVGASTDVVAFTAHLSKDITELAHAYQIKFEQVVTNVGNAYNPVTGVFTCPKAGVYIFSWTAALLSSGYLYTKLVKNGASVATSFTSDDHFHSQSSAMAVLVLNQGDIVGVTITGHTTSPAVWHPYTSFTGFLLH